MISGHAKARLYRMLILIFIGFFLLLMGAKVSAQISLPQELKPMRTEEIQSIIYQAKDSWIEGNADTFASLFTPNGELIVPGFRWVGKQAIRQVAAEFAANSSDVMIEIRRILIDKNQAVVEWYWEDTENATGFRNRADDAIIVDFVNGKISQWREYIDTKTPASG